MEDFASQAQSVAWHYWLIPVGLVVVGLVVFNWSKVRSAFVDALPEAPKVDLPSADASLDQIGSLKNGFALLLELDRYSPPSMTKDDRDKRLVEGVALLLKARSEART